MLPQPRSWRRWSSPSCACDGRSLPSFLGCGSSRARHTAWAAEHSHQCGSVGGCSFWSRCPSNFWAVQLALSHWDSNSSWSLIACHSWICQLDLDRMAWQDYHSNCTPSARPSSQQFCSACHYLGRTWIQRNKLIDNSQKYWSADASYHIYRPSCCPSRAFFPPSAPGLPWSAYCIMRTFKFQVKLILLW